MTSFLAWEHRSPSREPFVTFFILNTLEAQVSMALCQAKRDILKETDRIPILEDVYWLWTEWYKYEARCVLGCEFNLDVSSQIPIFLLASGAKNEMLRVECLRLLRCSVAQFCPALCNPMDCSMPGFPVHHQLSELAQTHVHWVDDAIQPSHPLSSPSYYSILLFSHLAIVYPQGRTSELLEGLISLMLPHIHLLLTLAIIPVPINRLSIFISSCSSDVQTIFSTAEKHEDREEDILFFIKELGWNEHRKREPSAQIFLSLYLFYFPQRDVRFKERIQFCSERNECVTSVEYTRIFWISLASVLGQKAVFVDLLNLCLAVWDERGSSPTSPSRPVSPDGWLSGIHIW